ncbi:MAG TPA: metallopeptidase family protein [Miltoncostaeaceae bacterium]|nr:metallopeptidase family protein [Miltoncostaeaceae bacterium]
MDRRRFETLVARAIDDVPPPFAAALDEVAVVVESRAPAGDPDLYGLYEGVPLDEPWAAPGALPARIVVFMHPLIDDCSSDEEVVEEVRITVLHELGHHLGMGEEQLDDLGYG